MSVGRALRGFVYMPSEACSRRRRDKYFAQTFNAGASQPVCRCFDPEENWEKASVAKEAYEHEDGGQCNGTGSWG